MVLARVTRGDRWRAWTLVVALVVGLFVPAAALAKPNPKPAAKPSASAAPSGPATATVPQTVPSVDFWNGGGPPPELPPKPAAEPAKEREIAPAAPSEEGKSNARSFAIAILVGGAFCVFIAFTRIARGDAPEVTPGPDLANMVIPPAPPAAPAPVQQEAYGAPQQQAYGQGSVSQQGYGPASVPPQAQYQPQGQYGPPSMPQQGGYGPASMPPQAQVMADSPQVGEVVGDKYRIDSVIGRDDFGVKYAVTFAQLGQSCSIYVLRQEFTGSAPHYARMSELARASAAAPQPGFQVFDMGQLRDGRPFLVIR